MGKPAGVGIYFQESGSDIVVNHLIRGGSAERSGKVQAGDVIVSIDDKDVRAKGVSEMRNFIVGPEGSTVNLGFNRNGQEFIVALLRGSPEYISSVMGPSAAATKSPMVIHQASPRMGGQVGPPETKEDEATKQLAQENQNLKQMLAQAQSEAAQMQSPPQQLLQENDNLKRMLAQAQSDAAQASQLQVALVEQKDELTQHRSQSAGALQQMQQLSEQMQQMQEGRAKAERDVETHRRVAQDLQMALRKEQEEVKKMKTASPVAQGPGPAEFAAMQQQMSSLQLALQQSKSAQVLLAKKAQESQLMIENVSRSAPAAANDSAGEMQRLRGMLETKNAECQRLQTEVRTAKEETRTSVAQLQEAMQIGEAASGTPMQLDAEFRDTGRAAIIALPHVLTHLQNVIDNQDRIRSLVPVTTVMMHALESSRQKCAGCIPQAVPQLVSLLVSRQPTTVREASFALSLTSMSADGRKAILSMPQAIAHLETLLSSGDLASRRNGAMALGNLAMESSGRKGMLEVFTIVQDLTQLLSTDDLDCRRSSCLALGNLVIEEEARDHFLGVAMSVRGLSEQLKSRDRFLVRYATGAIRNVAVDEKGRRAVLAQQDAVAALKGLLASPDETTAKFAASALRNLSLTPFSSNMGPSDPIGKAYQGSSRIQMPERTTASFLGLPVPFADSDGRDIPMTLTQSRAVNGSISL